jgi:hypothetical protein
MAKSLRLVLAAAVAAVVLAANLPNASAAWAVSIQAGSTGNAVSTGAPVAPATVAANCTNLLISNQMTVTWTGVAHATSYTVYVATAAATGPYSVTATVSASPWTSPALASNFYWFEVVANVGPNWPSPFSAASGVHGIGLALLCL